MKMLEMQDKRGEMEQGKTVAIILVLLVIAVVAVIIFRQDITSWIRSLPGYEQSGDQTIHASKLTDAEVKSFCPIRIGFFEKAKGVGIFEQDYIFLRENGESRQTPFYLAKYRIWRHDYSLIRIAEFGADDVVGAIEGIKIKITNFKQGYEKDLERLDGSMFKEGAHICKEQ